MELVLAPGFAEDFAFARGELGGQVNAEAQSRLLGTAVPVHPVVKDAVQGQAIITQSPWDRGSEGLLRVCKRSLEETGWR